MVPVLSQPVWNMARIGQRRSTTTTNLLETFESWTRALDERCGIDVIYLDYRKAFDTVPHQRLIYKLSQIGITGKALMGQ